VATNGVLFALQATGGNLFPDTGVAPTSRALEFRLAPNGNNGIGAARRRGRPAYVGWYPVLDNIGSEHQRLEPCTHNHTTLDPTGGWLRCAARAPVGEWNSEEIDARGRRITVRLERRDDRRADLDDVRDEAL